MTALVTEESNSVPNVLDTDTLAIDTSIDDGSGVLNSAWFKKTLWALLWISGASAILLALLLGAKTYLRSNVLTQFAVIDIEEVLNVRRAEFLAMVNKPGVTDEDRGHAYDFIRKSGTDITLAVKDLAKECQCLILVKSAVYNPEQVQDLTPLLRERVGISSQAVGVSQSAADAATKTLGAKP
jgi:hypothetical protein